MASLQPVLFSAHIPPAVPHLGLCLLQYIEQTRLYSETSLIRHSMGPENNVGLGGCWIMECFLPYLCMVTVPHIMVGLERILDYRGVGLPSDVHGHHVKSVVVVVYRFQ